MIGAPDLYKMLVLLFCITLGNYMRVRVSWMLDEIRPFRVVAAVFASIFICVSEAPKASAVESGFGVYLLGSKGPASGYLPPAGFYIASQQFHYRGDYSGPINAVPGIISDADIEVGTDFNMLSPVWITNQKILGGRLGVSATLPLGEVDVALDTLGTFTQETGFWLGDLLFSIFAGWNYKKFHWNAGVTMVAPIGEYSSDRLSNLALNRASLDVFGALSWIDPATGIDISGAIGVTFNAENTETNYRSGTEFHGEWAISKFLSPQLSIGVMGYHYEQLTADSGLGATLGDFKGRATAIGGFVNYRFQVDQRAVSVRLQALDEFNVKNRFEGTPVSLHLVIDLTPSGVYSRP